MHCAVNTSYHGNNPHVLPTLAMYAFAILHDYCSHVRIHAAISTLSLTVQPLTVSSHDDCSGISKNPTTIISFRHYLQTEIPDETINEETSLGTHNASNVRSASSLSPQHSALAVVKVFLNVRNGSWILTVVFLGASSGLTMGFLYWHLENIGEDR